MKEEKLNKREYGEQKIGRNIIKGKKENRKYRSKEGRKARKKKEINLVLLEKGKSNKENAKITNEMGN